MEYGLARMVLDTLAFVPVTESEYQEIQLAREGLLECLFMEEKYDLLIENFFELETSLFEIAARNMVRHRLDYRAIHLERNLIDRRIVNLLSAGRTYIDHSKQHVHRILPREASEKFDVEAIFSQQYDTRFGYRCMEALRNHVLHRGFPVHNIKFERQWVEREDRKLMQFAISPYLDPVSLRDAGKFKKEILEEMDAKGKKIDLKALIRDYVEGLSEVHTEIRQRLHDMVRRWEDVLHKTIVNYQSAHPEEGTVGLAAIKRRPDGTHKEELPVFTDFIEQRQYFETKNGALKNLTKRFVTSEVIEQ